MARYPRLTGRFASSHWCGFMSDTTSTKGIDMAGKKKKSGSVINQLGTTARLVRTSLAERLFEHRFYAGQDQIMLALGQAGTMTPGQLASLIGVQPPTVSKTINRLQEQGFVERNASGADARRSEISLTDAGEKALVAIEKAVGRTEKQALSGLTKKDKRKLKKLLARVETNLDD